MNKEIIELREVVTKLVPLLTGKGLVVSQRGSRAYVSVNRQTLKPDRVNIPNISDNATPDFIRAIQGFIDHEVAHVLITNWDDYLVKGNPADPKIQRLQTMVNIVEDTMIEREIVKIFPGSRKNIADLRRHFIDKITIPAVKQARGDEKAIFEVIIVPAMRALAGHEEFQEYMDREKLWENKYIKELVDKLSPATKELLPKMTNTKQTRAAAEEIDKIIYSRTPPQQQQPQQPPQQGGQSQDKPDKKAGAGSGTGERDHSESEDGEKGDEDASEKKKSGKKPKKDDDDAEDGDDESSDGDGSDDEEDEDADSDADGGADEDDEDQEGEGEDQEGDGSQDDEEGAGDKGDSGESEASGGSAGEDDEDEDEDGDGQGAGGDSSAGGDADEGEEGEESGKKAHGDTISIDNRDSKAGKVGDEEDRNGGGGGVGGDGSARSVFDDIEDDAFESADISSQVSILITKEAVTSIRASDYSVYTREFDRIEKVQVPKNMTEKWVTDLEDTTRQMTGRMQKDIERMLASQSHVVRTPGWKSGRLHAPALHRLTTGDDRVFNRKQEHQSKDTAVTLLIDNSGSMSGAKLNTAMSAGYALSSTLERVSIAHEVLGFTTGNWFGAPASISQAMNEEIMQSGVRFSRTIPIHMPIFKEFDERINSEVKRRFAYVQRAQLGLNGNVDGESLEYGAIRLLKRREKRKVMIVLSDGHPVCADNADGHLKMTVEKLNKMGVDTVGIGIMDNAVQYFYDKHTVLHKIEDLPGQVMKELKTILT